MSVSYYKLADKLRNGESLFSEPLPVPRDLVLLEESDSSETDESQASEFDVDIDDVGISSDNSTDSGDFEHQLNKIMGKTIEKLGFENQLTQATKHLQDR